MSAVSRSSFTNPYSIRLFSRSSNGTDVSDSAIISLCISNAIPDFKFRHREIFEVSVRFGYVFGLVTKIWLAKLETETQRPKFSRRARVLHNYLLYVTTV